MCPTFRKTTQPTQPTKTVTTIINYFKKLKCYL